MPPSGRAELQVDRGVLTTKLQLLRSEDRRVLNGFKNIVNTPALSVVVLETTVPPHCSCTAASAWYVIIVLRTLLYRQ